MWSFIGMLLLVLASSPADTSQTSQERYGQPVPDPNAHEQPGTENFQIRPGIFASAQYGKSGRVCHILVRPAQPFSSMNSRKNTIGSRSQVDGILGELMPVKERGRYVIGTFLICCASVRRMTRCVTAAKKSGKRLSYTITVVMTASNTPKFTGSGTSAIRLRQREKNEVMLVFAVAQPGHRHTHGAVR